jgi:3-hydroxyacyl-[acyl-carrier-protein] dehydratase
VKRVGLKYCGGCNPSYERVEYVQAIQKAAGSRIEWVTLDEGDFSSLLIICGCEKQCVEIADHDVPVGRVIHIKDDLTPPTEILSLLLE